MQRRQGETIQEDSSRKSWLEGGEWGQMIRAHSGFRSRQREELEEEKRRQDKKEEVDFTMGFVGKRAELHGKQLIYAN